MSASHTQKGLTPKSEVEGPLAFQLALEFLSTDYQPALPHLPNDFHDTPGKTKTSTHLTSSSLSLPGEFRRHQSTLHLVLCFLHLICQQSLFNEPPPHCYPLLHTPTSTLPRWEDTPPTTVIFLITSIILGWGEQQQQRNQLSLKITREMLLEIKQFARSSFLLKMSTSRHRKVIWTPSWRAGTAYSISQVFLWTLQKPDSHKLSKNKLSWKLLLPLIALGVWAANAVNTESNKLPHTPEKKFFVKITQ